MPDPPTSPYRVTREFKGAPLTRSQQRILTSLVATCPEAGCDVDARTVAEHANLRLGSVVVVLRSLERQRLAVVHEGEDGRPDGWAPTLTGRSRVRHFPAQQPDGAPADAAE